MYTYKGKNIESSENSDLYTVHRAPTLSMLKKVEPHFHTYNRAFYLADQFPLFNQEWIKDKKRSLDYDEKTDVIVYVKATKDTNTTLVEVDINHPIELIDENGGMHRMYVRETGGDQLKYGSQRKTTYAVLRSG